MDEPKPRRVRTTSDRIFELRDVVTQNLRRYQEKEDRLAKELATVRAARVAAEAEMERIAVLVAATPEARTLPLPLPLGEDEPPINHHSPPARSAADVAAEMASYDVQDPMTPPPAPPS